MSKLIPLIDIGVNLTHESFAQDLPQVLQRAYEKGVTTQIITGASLTGSEQAIALCEQFPEYELYCTVGVHPHEAHSFDHNTQQALADLLQHPKVKAVGEMGLDHHRDFSTPTQQRYAFEQQLELAINCQLPLFLHERDAFPDLYDMLKNYRDHISDVVIHCFTGEKNALFAYLDLNCHIGITGWICDERRGTHLLELVPNIPLDRLMIETDAPYLIPRDLKLTTTSPAAKNIGQSSRRNEPSYLPHIAERIARCYGKSFEEIGLAATETAKRFFRI